MGNSIALSNNTANSHSSINMKLRSLSCQDEVTAPLTGVKVVCQFSVERMILMWALFFPSVVCNTVD